MESGKSRFWSWLCTLRFVWFGVMYLLLLIFSCLLLHMWKSGYIPAIWLFFSYLQTTLCFRLLGLRLCRPPFGLANWLRRRQGLFLPPASCSSEHHSPKASAAAAKPSLQFSSTCRASFPGSPRRPQHQPRPEAQGWSPPPLHFQVLVSPASSPCSPSPRSGSCFL